MRIKMSFNDCKLCKIKKANKIGMHHSLDLPIMYLSTNSCIIMCIQDFMAKRRHSIKIACDKETNFCGADSELRK